MSAARAAGWAALAALAVACSGRMKQELETALDRTRSGVGSAGARIGENLPAAYELTRGAAGTLLESARSMDAAMNGCSLAERDAFELDGSEEYYVGRTLAAEHLAALKAQDLGPDHPVSRYVDRVGQLLAISAEVYGEKNVAERWRDLPERDIPNRPWPFGGYHFIVLDRPEPNAFGGPGGAVMVTTGLLGQLQSEEELAAVLAHEVAHVQRGHGVEVMKAFMCQHSAQEKASAPLREAAAKAKELGDQLPQGFAIKNASNEALGELLASITEQAKALFAVGYPRPFELEADRIGVRYLELAGYDPGAMRALFERLGAAGGEEDDYDVTHPKFEARVAAVAPVIASVDASKRPGEADVALRAERFRAAMAKLPRRAGREAAARPIADGR